MLFTTPIPSFRSGFARSVGESENPELWDSLCALYHPGMGHQGNKLYDFSGNVNNGTFSSVDPATDWFAGELGLGVNFAGGSDYIDCGAGASLPTNKPFTLLAVATVATQDTTNYPRYISRLSGSPFNGYELLLGKTNDVNHPSKFYLQCGNGGTLSTCNTVSTAVTGATYRVLATLDVAGTATIWLNGKFERTASLGATPIGTPGVNMYLGKWPGGANSAHNGLFHFAAVWKRALTYDECAFVSNDPVAMLRPRSFFPGKRGFKAAYAGRSNTLIQAGVV